MQAHAVATISDDDFRGLQIVSADAAEHAERIREIEQLGATTVFLMNISGADPLAAVETYAADVLPAVRGRTLSGRRPR
jgi:coenzyme F420-dependent glucose-6-phosphate dehydrogenase